ncbi:MAG: hypothetical protein Q8M37_09350 [Nevskia sp.]|nr:hypothetical protein [Nevskia sp.]
MKGIVVAVAALMVSGCASLPTPEQLSVADYGSDMTPEECVSVVERTLANTLKDPGSAQFRHSPCIKGALNSVPVMGLPVVYGWLQQGQLNAKNSYGGYVGFRSYMAMIRNGAVVRYCLAMENGTCAPVSLGG